MNNRTVGKIARFIVNLCDWMMGYHGKMVEELLVGLLFGIPTTFFFMWFMIVMS